jgi:EAL domain-containing protein (putative c-di-GMP-specific phosphodiesterase class I)
VDRSHPRRAIIAGVVAMCSQLSIDVIAEGIETADEAHCLSDLGITLMQGYWFARPRLEAAASEADISWDA